MTDSKQSWSEADSKLFQDMGIIAVPARAEQIATILTLLPFQRADTFRVVDVGCGEGSLSYALLDCFPKAEVVALDGSKNMRQQATRRLSIFGTRAQVAAFDLFSSNWLSYVEGTDCLLSSLCLHHLDGEEKQKLFAAVAHRLSPRGVLLIADIVAPQRREIRSLFAVTWDRVAEAQSKTESGSRYLYERFVDIEWNYYHFGDRTADHPSPLFHQLNWLKAAGFGVVDCFWLQAGHAIYGGYKTDSSNVGGDVSFTNALHLAKKALRS